MSENLRRALAAARLQAVDVAAALAVDPKTVHRWMKGRIPYPRHRWAVADLLQVDEAELWPEIASSRSISDDVQAVYPHRWAVPHSVWRRLFAGAEKRIDVLTYSGLFLVEDAGMLRLFAARARAGVRVRILLGDPDSPEVAARGASEGIGPDVMAARIRNALALYRQLRGIEGVEIRRHRTVLYNSIYRADDDLLVNIHAYGTPAAQAPVIHVRATENGDTAAVYLTSLERVWATAELAESRT
ncbi:XRE family transcriptional regulator [Microtetraspora malaysiensis]|uniref:XRE family transcriptional regulator n=1 Tax=Microtetraspora malaysiensis TaxID=161358 RepID=UPI003D93C3AD